MQSESVQQNDTGNDDGDDKAVFTEWLTSIYLCI